MKCPPLPSGERFEPMTDAAEMAPTDAAPIDAAPIDAAPTLTFVNLNAPDPHALARFYQHLLGWKITSEQADDVVLGPPGGGVGLSFQRETEYVRPTWPATPGAQQMMMHLEIRVTDLDSGVALAVEGGATVAEFQPQDDVRVCLDPAGHPFCLYL
jgi:catechol 2,3-dioxygenase-like lactoylglutathione lyase family enzyme